MKPMKQVMLSKIESTYATDPTPTAAANAILIGNAQLTPMIQDAKERGGLKPYLGNRGQVIAGQHVGLNYDIEIAGAGSAGSAPGFGPNLRAAAFAEKINAADVTGTAQAGAASTITLAAAESATDNIYQYMRINITGGTGSGQSRVIRSYVGSTKVATLYEDWTTPPDATSQYNIIAQVAYTPISASEESITSYFNIDGVQHAMNGVRSDLALKLAMGAIPLFSLKDLGLYSVPTDTALPTPTLTGFQNPKAVNNANTTATLHGYAGIFSDISLALNNAMAYRNLVNSEQIYFSDRKPNGSVTLEHPTLAAKDFYSIAAAETLGSLDVTHGTTSGNIVGIYCPAVQLLNPTDQGGGNSPVRELGLSLDIQPVDGNDDIIIHVY